MRKRTLPLCVRGGARDQGISPAPGDYGGEQRDFTPDAAMPFRSQSRLE
jgi:hypothetical protein